MELHAAVEGQGLLLGVDRQARRVHRLGEVGGCVVRHEQLRDADREDRAAIRVLEDRAADRTAVVFPHDSAVIETLAHVLAQVL